jgi:hypothetical protein
MEDDIKPSTIIKWALSTVAIIAVLILGGYEIDIHWISPVARQDQLNSPNRTINLRQDFHNKLTEVITADTNIVSLAQKIQTNRMQVTDYVQSQNYQDDQTALSSLITIRAGAISAYNEQAQGTDTKDWNDVCMPHSIENTALDQTDMTLLIANLNKEKSTLTAKDGIC